MKGNPSPSLPTRTLAGALVALLAFVACGPPAGARAQELNCSVSVNIQQIGGTEYEFLREDFRRAVADYVNQQAWTDDRFARSERINCSMQVIMQQAVSVTRFSARLAVSARRPIYGAAQTTTLFSLSDGSWTFDYARGTPLVRRPNQYDEITSVLDFYAYLILGYDYDTFSQLGGTSHFQEARRIAERAEALGGSGGGWSTMAGSRSRSELIRQILDPRFRALREAYFTYHFQALDRFLDEARQARQTVLSVLGSLDRLYQQVSRAYAIDLFFAAKYEELAALFAGAPTSNTAYDVLSRLDPSHTSTYNRLVN
jgi:hypothetical protein